MALIGAHFGSGNGDILLDNVVCQGNETSLLECDTNPVGQHDCDHSEDAGVRCGGTSHIQKVIDTNSLCLVTVIHFIDVIIPISGF